MYQHLVLVGNVGQDPKMRFLPDGRAVCNFSVAVNERWTDRQTNEKREKTIWFRVACWGRLAEIVNQHVSKGRQVLVEASEITASAWTGNDGKPMAAVEVTAKRVTFLGSRDSGGEGERPPQREAEEIPF